MNTTKLLIIIGIVILICGVSIGIFCLIFSSNSQLRDALISETVGGGILGAIVAGMFFYLQESGENQTSKKKALSFYEDKLILDINEVFDRAPSAFNFSGLHKFYFDGSRINALYDVYESNFHEINNYKAYYTDNKLVNTFKIFYKEARKGYVLGEKLEGVIYQIVRKEHHKRQVSKANDYNASGYLKGHLFISMEDNDIIKYLDLQSVPARMAEIVEIFKNDVQATELLREVNIARGNLLSREREIENILRNFQRSLESNHYAS